MARIVLDRPSVAITGDPSSYGVFPPAFELRISGPKPKGSLLIQPLPFPEFIKIRGDRFCCLPGPPIPPNVFCLLFREIAQVLKVFNLATINQFFFKLHHPGDYGSKVIKANRSKGSVNNHQYYNSIPSFGSQAPSAMFLNASCSGHIYAYDLR